LNSNKKSNLKLLLTTFGVLTASFFSLNSCDFAKAAEPDLVNVESVTTQVQTNMLNVDTAIITKASVTKMLGKNQDVSVTFANVPETTNKVFAVLVDVIAGGVIQAQYLDSNNMVKFTNIPEYIKIPGIHLYEQSPTDPDFVLRKENFIASTSYLLPYGKKIENNGGLVVSGSQKPANEVFPYKGDGTVYPNVPSATLFTTTIPNVYSLAIPKNFLLLIDGAKDLLASNLLAAVIAEDENKNTLEVRQWVSTDYNENDNFCRFEFLLPDKAKNVQIHLYKYGLFEENFLCKFLATIDKQAATNYTLTY